MNRSILKQVILEQNPFQPTETSLIARIKHREILQHAKTPHAVIVTGLRRSGKSTLLYQTLTEHYKDQFYYLNFEDERLLDFTVKDFNLLYEIFLELYGEHNIFFLDEIQNIPKWETFVRRMQDKGLKFFITGSNASLLSQELGTKLTGRHISVELLPFSFKEFLSFKQIEPSDHLPITTQDRAKLKRLFNEYLENGGMPEYLIYQDPFILKSIYDDILFRDIIARYEIKEIKAFRELALYLISNIARPFAYNKLKNMLQLGSITTVKNYIQYLENSFLFFTLNRYTHSLKQQTIANKKIYCIDNALAKLIGFQVSNDRGIFLENLVFLELRRKAYDCYYYKTKNDLEIDFLIRQGNKVTRLIQVAENLSRPETRDRELKALVAGMIELDIDNGLILTLNHEETVEQNGKTIHIRPIDEWLLQPESNPDIS